MTETEECWDIPESTPTSATAPAGLNALLAEEVGWVQALDVASREQGIPVSLESVSSSNQCIC